MSPHLISLVSFACVLLLLVACCAETQRLPPFYAIDNKTTTLSISPITSALYIRFLRPDSNVPVVPFGPVISIPATGTPLIAVATQICSGHLNFSSMAIDATNQVDAWPIEADSANNNYTSQSSVFEWHPATAKSSPSSFDSNKVGVWELRDFMDATFDEDITCGLLCDGSFGGTQCSYSACFGGTAFAQHALAITCDGFAGMRAVQRMQLKPQSFMQIQNQFTISPLVEGYLLLLRLPGNTKPHLLFRAEYYNNITSTAAQMRDTTIALCRMAGYTDIDVDDPLIYYFSQFGDPSHILVSNLSCPRTAMNIIHDCTFDMAQSKFAKQPQPGPARLLNVVCGTADAPLANWRFATFNELPPEQQAAFPASTPPTLLLARPPGGDGVGRFGTVCDDGFTDLAAKAICASMGAESDFPQWSSMVNTQTSLIRGLSTILDDVSCAGGADATFAASCSYTLNHNCREMESVLLSCPGRLVFEYLAQSPSAATPELLRRNFAAFSKYSSNNNNASSLEPEQIPYYHSRVVARSTKDGALYELSALGEELGLLQDPSLLCSWLTKGRSTRAFAWAVEPLSNFRRNKQAVSPSRNSSAEEAFVLPPGSTVSYMQYGAFMPLTTVSVSDSRQLDYLPPMGAIAVSCGVFANNETSHDEQQQPQPNRNILQKHRDNVLYFPAVYRSAESASAAAANEKSRFDLWMQLGVTSNVAPIASFSASLVNTTLPPICVQGPIDIVTARVMCRAMGFAASAEVVSVVTSPDHFTRLPNANDRSMFNLKCSPSAIAFVDANPLTATASGVIQQFCNFTVAKHPLSSTGDQVNCVHARLRCGVAQESGDAVKIAAAQKQQEPLQLLRTNTVLPSTVHETALTVEMGSQRQRWWPWPRLLCKLEAPLARAAAMHFFGPHTFQNKYVAAFYNPADDYDEDNKNAAPASGIIAKSFFADGVNSIDDAFSWDSQSCSVTNFSIGAGGRWLPGMAPVANLTLLPDSACTQMPNSTAAASAEIRGGECWYSTPSNNNAQVWQRRPADRLVLGQQGIAFRIGPENILLAAVDEPDLKLDGGDWGYVSPYAVYQNYETFGKSTAEAVCRLITQSHPLAELPPAVCWINGINELPAPSARGKPMRINSLICYEDENRTLFVSGCRYRVVPNPPSSSTSGPSSTSTTTTTDPNNSMEESATAPFVRLFCDPALSPKEFFRSISTPSTPIGRVTQCNWDFTFTHKPFAGVVVAVTAPQWGPVRGFLCYTAQAHALAEYLCALSATPVAPFIPDRSSHRRVSLARARALYYAAVDSGHYYDDRDFNSNSNELISPLMHAVCRQGASTFSMQDCAIQTTPPDSCASGEDGVLAIMCNAVSTPLLELPGDLSFVSVQAKPAGPLARKVNVPALRWRWPNVTVPATDSALQLVSYVTTWDYRSALCDSIGFVGAIHESVQLAAPSQMVPMISMWNSVCTPVAELSETERGALVYRNTTHVCSSYTLTDSPWIAASLRCFNSSVQLCGLGVLACDALWWMGAAWFRRNFDDSAIDDTSNSIREGYIAVSLSLGAAKRLCLAELQAHCAELFPHTIDLCSDQDQHIGLFVPFQIDTVSDSAMRIPQSLVLASDDVSPSICSYDLAGECVGANTQPATARTRVAAVSCAFSDNLYFRPWHAAELMTKNGGGHVTVAQAVGEMFHVGSEVPLPICVVDNIAASSSLYGAGSLLAAQQNFVSRFLVNSNLSDSYCSDLSFVAGGRGGAADETVPTSTYPTSISLAFPFRLDKLTHTPRYANQSRWFSRLNHSGYNSLFIHLHSSSTSSTNNGNGAWSSPDDDKVACAARVDPDHLAVHAQPYAACSNAGRAEVRAGCDGAVLSIACHVPSAVSMSSQLPMAENGKWMLYHEPVFGSVRLLPPADSYFLSEPVQEVAGGLCAPMAAAVPAATAATVNIVQQQLTTEEIVERWLNREALETARVVCGGDDDSAGPFAYILSPSLAEGSADGSSDQDEEDEAQAPLSPLQFIAGRADFVGYQTSFSATHVVSSRKAPSTASSSSSAQEPSSDYSAAHNGIMPSLACNLDTLKRSRLTCGAPLFEVVNYTTTKSSSSSGSGATTTQLFLAGATFEGSAEPDILRIHSFSPSAQATNWKKVLPESPSSFPLLCGDAFNLQNPTTPSRRRAYMAAVAELCSQTVLKGTDSASISGSIVATSLYTSATDNLAGEAGMLQIGIAYFNNNNNDNTADDGDAVDGEELTARFYLTPRQQRRTKPCSQLLAIRCVLVGKSNVTGNNSTSGGAADAALSHAAIIIVPTVVIIVAAVIISKLVLTAWRRRKREQEEKDQLALQNSNVAALSQAMLLSATTFNGLLPDSRYAIIHLNDDKDDDDDVGHANADAADDTAVEMTAVSGSLASPSGTTAQSWIDELKTTKQQRRKSSSSASAAATAAAGAAASLPAAAPSAVPVLQADDVGREQKVRMPLRTIPLQLSDL